MKIHCFATLTPEKTIEVKPFIKYLNFFMDYKYARCNIPITRYVLNNLSDLIDYYIENNCPYTIKAVIQAMYDVDLLSRYSCFKTFEKVAMELDIEEGTVRRRRNYFIRKIYKSELGRVLRSCAVMPFNKYCSKNALDTNNVISNYIKDDIDILINGTKDDKNQNFLPYILDRMDASIECKSNNPFKDVEYHTGSDKTVFKYVANDELINPSLYEYIFCQKDSIANYSMSLGLAVLLMLKGYWYMDSIIENMIYIHDSMTFGGYNEQAEELKSIVSKVSAEKWKNRSESQQILLLYDLGCVEIEDNEIDFIITYEDLIAFSQNACSDTYINSCEELKKVLDSDELYTEIINEFKKC